MYKNIFKKCKIQNVALVYLQLLTITCLIRIMQCRLLIQPNEGLRKIVILQTYYLLYYVGYLLVNLNYST